MERERPPWQSNQTVPCQWSFWKPLNFLKRWRKSPGRRKRNFSCVFRLCTILWSASTIIACINPSGSSITIYVDSSFTGNYKTGSYLSPYTNITEAVNSLPLTDSNVEKIIHVFSGTYTDTISLNNAQNLSIEGGTDKFQWNPSSTLTITNSKDIVLRYIDFQFPSTVAISISSSDVDLENITVNGTGNLITADSSSMNGNQLTFTTTSTIYDALSFSNAESIKLDNITVSGGNYSINVNTANELSLTNVNLSSMNKGGIQLNSVLNPIISTGNIGTIPLTSDTDAAGIYISNSHGGRIEKLTITGGGTAGSDVQNGISVFTHNVVDSSLNSIFYLNDLNIQNCGRAGIYVNTSQNVWILNNTITNSRRGLFLKFPNTSPYAQDPDAAGPQYNTVDIYKTTVENATLAGAYFENMYANIDFLVVKNTSGPGIWINNTVSNVISKYFIGNVSELLYNSQQGILVNGTGMYVSVTNVKFEGNGGYGIEAPVQSDPSQFFCQGNTWISQSLTIHPNLTSNSANECNL
ncbi:MAG: hypothetical protein D6767_07105 [Candidatus Hydrogenedentota bacterium]|nr:MAG: hypothetical protein D6767_07105 [Candidatus Hydrogenedentota bacterium]